MAPLARGLRLVACAPPATPRSSQLVSSRPLRSARGIRSLATRAILQVPWILHTVGAGAGRRRHHALLERGEAAVSGAGFAGVLGAPRPVDFSGAWRSIDRGEQGYDE
jgi:hypothetical protein